MKKSCYLLALASVSFVLGSCNTFIGMGRDIQKLGTGMQNKGYGRSWDGSQQQTPTAPGANPYGVPAQ